MTHRGARKTPTPALTVGSQNGSGQLPSPAGPPAHFKLRAFRTSDSTVQYWTDTVVGLAAAPGGAGNFDAATLTVEGRF